MTPPTPVNICPKSCNILRKVRKLLFWVTSTSTVVPIYCGETLLQFSAILAGGVFSPLITYMYTIILRWGRFPHMRYTIPLPRSWRLWHPPLWFSLCTSCWGCGSFAALRFDILRALVFFNTLFSMYNICVHDFCVTYCLERINYDWTVFCFWAKSVQLAGRVHYSAWLRGGHAWFQAWLPFTQS